MIEQTTPHIDARQLPQNNLMTLEAPTVYSVCKAFYNLSTTEVKIIELLADHGCFVGNAQDLAKRLGICYTQITSALTSLDNYGVILRNTTGDKKVRMVAVTLCPQWELNLVRTSAHFHGDSIKGKRPMPSQCNCY